MDDYQDEEEEEDIDGGDDDFMDGDYNPEDDDDDDGGGSEDDEDRVRYATWDPGAFPDRYKTADQGGHSDKNVKNPKANKEKVHYGGPRHKLIWRKGQVKKNGERYVNKDLFYFPQEGDRYYSPFSLLFVLTVLSIGNMQCLVLLW